MSRLPSQNQMLLPLIEEIAENGGRPPKQIYDRLAERLQIQPEAREHRVPHTVGRTRNRFDQHVRWSRQLGVLKGMIANDRRNFWDLTAIGEKRLANVKRGTVITLFETKSGVLLWANAEDAAGVVEHESVNLLFTSPPYPLLKPKTYGNADVSEWLDWMTGLARAWTPLLARDGSMMINLGPVYEPGRPTQSGYLERFIVRMLDDVGLQLAGRFYWENPAKMPAPAEWTTVRRVRVKDSIENIYWLSRSANPKADNRAVLKPYSESMKKLLASTPRKAVQHPSGHVMAEGAFHTDHGGAIPGNLIVASNTSATDEYRRLCRADGLALHPATFPSELPDFGIRLTTEPDDIVYDPFFGSGQTGAVAERLGRRWIGSERSLVYGRGASFRFRGTPGFTSHLPSEGCP